MSEQTSKEKLMSTLDAIAKRKIKEKAASILRRDPEAFVKTHEPDGGDGQDGN